jgi:hypothetical protein
MTTMLIFAVPGVIFDLDSFSFQVPICGSSAKHSAALEEHRKVEKLEATVAGLVATVKEQASQIQKVSAQLELSKPAPQTVLNNH